MDNKTLFPPGTDPKTIKDSLLGQCHSTESMVYQKPLSEEELTVLEKEFIQASVKYAKLTDDFNKLKEEFKNKMKPVEQLQKEQLKVLKVKTQEVEGIVYLVDDQDNKTMSYYAETGELIMVRPLMSTERQLTINRQIANG